MRQKNNIPSDVAQFLRTQIDSTDLENEILTTKIWRNKAEKTIFFKKKNISKDLETDETIKQNKYLKKILDKEINQIK